MNVATDLPIETDWYGCGCLHPHYVALLRKNLLGTIAECLHLILIEQLALA